MQLMPFLRFLLDIVFPPRDTEALVRTATLTSLGSHVRPITLEDGRSSLMPYQKPLVRALIVEAKFRMNEHAETLLAGVLEEYLESWLQDREAYEAQSVVLVPIPLSQARLRERGYNQAERIALRVSRSLPTITVQAVLERVRHTAPQTSLTRHARLKNMNDAFRVRVPVSKEHTYIVFDDVSTTGATLFAARDALIASGAKQVFLLSLAH